MRPVTNLRPELFRHLRQRLEAFREGFRHNLAIIGPPGSGKTFQLQQLLAPHPLNPLIIYCPLYRESCRSFLQRLQFAILQTVESDALSPAAAMPTCLPAGTAGRQATGHQPLEELLQRLEPQLPRTVAAIRPIEELVTRRLFGEAFNRTLDVIPVLTQERGRPCAVILDEFLFLEELGLTHAFHELGKRVMIWPSTWFILSSSSPYRARLILRERLQLLFGQFELLTLNALDLDASTTWLQQELRGIRGANTVTPFLIQWLGAYPWYLAVFLKRLRELAALGQRPDFSEALFLHTAWDVLGSPEGPLHQWCASKTEGLAQGHLGTRAMEVLLHVAQGARTATDIGKRTGRAGLSDALQRLVEHDVALRNGMCWMVTDPVLRCWLSTVLSLQRLEPRLNDTDVRARFEQYLRALWARWMSSSQLSLAEQMVELFAKFDDETVSLDSKTGRLPKFQTIRTHQPDGPGPSAYLIAHGEGKQWCATVHEGPVSEPLVASFDAFCRTQTPKPSRKVVITRSTMDQNARLLAKATSMWVWGTDDLQVLRGLYGTR